MEPTTNNLDPFLKIWAVLGPLIAAAASAMWARNIQIVDRKHEHTREQELFKREEIRKKQEHEREIQLQKYQEVKSGLADFLASSNEYVRKQTDYLNTLLPERYQAATIANDKFAYSCQLVILLGNHEVANKAIDLWNNSIVLPMPYKSFDAKYEEKLHACKESRAAFIEVARTYLAELEARTPTSSIDQIKPDSFNEMKK